MTRQCVLNLEQGTRWMDILAQSFQHGFCHLPSYVTALDSFSTRKVGWKRLQGLRRKGT